MGDNGKVLFSGHNGDTMKPSYDFDKIKFATDGPTFEKAVGLYEGGKITEFKEYYGGYSAIVLGGKPYEVSVSARHYDHGRCACYLGENDTLCKHMVAVAIRAVTGGKPLTDEDKRRVSKVTRGGRLRELSKGELSSVKKEITGAMKYIKPYECPSRTWLAYQNSLQEGVNRLSKIISDLLVGEQTAKLLVDMLLRLDDKLCRGGVDDSDGAVGGFIEEAVRVLQEHAKLDLVCIRAFKKLHGRETCFGWEESLPKLIK